MVTHGMRFARGVADRVVMMADGAIVEVSDASTFFTDPKEARSRAFLDRVLKK